MTDPWRRPVTIKIAITLLAVTAFVSFFLIFLDPGYEIPHAFGYMLAILASVFSGAMLLIRRSAARIPLALFALCIVYGVFDFTQAFIHHPVMVYLLVIVAAILVYLPPTNRWYSSLRRRQRESDAEERKMAEKRAGKFTASP